MTRLLVRTTLLFLKTEEEILPSFLPCEYFDVTNILGFVFVHALYAVGEA